MSHGTGSDWPPCRPADWLGGGGHRRGPEARAAEADRDAGKCGAYLTLVEMSAILMVHASENAAVERGAFSRC